MFTICAFRSKVRVYYWSRGELKRFLRVCGFFFLHYASFIGFSNTGVGSGSSNVGFSVCLSSSGSGLSLLKLCVPGHVGSVSLSNFFQGFNSMGFASLGKGANRGCACMRR